jgi:hypothetical protein
MQVADFLENCLKEWHEFVKRKRQVHSCLNMYTNEQLVLLQRYLAELELKEFSTVVLPLLSLLHPHCTKDHVQEAIRDGKFYDYIPKSYHSLSV